MSFSPFFFNKNATGAVRAITTNFQNASGSTLNKGTPVCVNTSGQIIGVNVASEASVLAIVGLTNVSIPNAAIGGVQDSGRLEDVSVAFTVGDPLWISKTGGLTNVKPENGIGGFTDGDFVIFVGVVVKNEFNPVLKDIKMMLSIVGQL